MDNRNFAIGFVVAFIIITLYTGIEFDGFVAAMTSGNFSTAITYYLLSRIDYLLILMSFLLLGISTPIREFFAGILFIWAVDIISFPRLPVTAFPTDLAFLANSDAFIMAKILSFTQWSYQFAWKFYYIVLPIILILGVVQILGLFNFANMVRGKQ